MNTNVAIALQIISVLLIVAGTVAAANSKAPPPVDPMDFSCLNAEIASLRTAGAATVQSQADLALAQADAFHRLAGFNQAC